MGQLGTICTVNIVNLGISSQACLITGGSFDSSEGPLPSRYGQLRKRLAQPSMQTWVAPRCGQWERLHRSPAQVSAMDHRLTWTWKIPKVPRPVCFYLFHRERGMLVIHLIHPIWLILRLVRLVGADDCLTNIDEWSSSLAGRVA